ncbi:hypothetical protein L9F63_020804, partial [Diploptera punctata]
FLIAHHVIEATVFLANLTLCVFTRKTNNGDTLKELVGNQIPMEKLLQHVIVNYRWVFVCFFLLPASLLFEIYNYARNWLTVKLKSAPLQHCRKVKDVQKQ